MGEAVRFIEIVTSCYPMHVVYIFLMLVFMSSIFLLMCFLKFNMIIKLLWQSCLQNLVYNIFVDMLVKGHNKGPQDLPVSTKVYSLS